MSTKVLQLRSLLEQDGLAKEITQKWDLFHQQRRPWIAEKEELRNYIFATDTTKTTNKQLPWKNKTTIPKICQIRDNLHANYVAGLFPNDTWFKWEGYSQDSVTKQKRSGIEAYMQNKVRMSGFRTEAYKLVYDYIDYGNCFWDITFVNETYEDMDGNMVQGYRGPKLERLSPYDIVFDPTASNFKDSWNIVRKVKSFGMLQWELDNMPELGYNKDIIEHAGKVRQGLNAYSVEDYSKAIAYSVDGFGNYFDYLASGNVEILEFEGSMYDPNTKKYLQNVQVTVIDRNKVVRIQKMPSWMGKTMKGHVGWRMRPDNCYAMGPLDNLVGMQYRIDHLENAKADAMDLAIHPPLAIIGAVEEFVWGPNEEVRIGEGGSVVELGKNIGPALQAEQQIAILEQKMEEMAGAPKHAMGFRTPGEKTRYEVQSLESAGSRIFQNKITHFEIECLEDALNKMFESSRRNMSGADLIRVVDDDLGVIQFMDVTKEDITASGKLRPIGARHYAAHANMLQDLTAFYNSPLGQDPQVRVHLSGKAIAKAVEELLGVGKFSLFSDNVRVAEEAETQGLMQEAQMGLEETGITPTQPELPPEVEAAMAQGKV